MQVFIFAVPNLKLMPTPLDGTFITVPMWYFRNHHPLKIQFIYAKI